MLTSPVESFTQLLHAVLLSHEYGVLHQLTIYYIIKVSVQSRGFLMVKKEIIAAVTNGVTRMAHPRFPEAPLFELGVGAKFLRDLGGLVFVWDATLNKKGLNATNYLNGWDFRVRVLVGLPCVDTISLKDHNLGLYASDVEQRGQFADTLLEWPGVQLVRLY